jgi:hypothetical protein
MTITSGKMPNLQISTTPPLRQKVPSALRAAPGLGPASFARKRSRPTKATALCLSAGEPNPAAPIEPTIERTGVLPFVSPRECQLPTSLPASLSAPRSVVAATGA